jgi:hypothetical protein
MSRNTKIVVGIIGGILAVCCLIAIVAALVLPQMFENFADGVDDPKRPLRWPLQLSTMTCPLVMMSRAR